MKHTIKCIIEYRNPLIVLGYIDPPSSIIGLGYLSTRELLTPESGEIS
jgi:hypothetical protein